MTRAQSPPRTAAGARAASQVADPETASEGAEHDLIVVVSVFPSQLLTSEMLRRSLESTEDLPVLVEFFLDKHSNRLKRPRPTIAEDALAALAAREWPGNVRELENAVERAVLLADSLKLTPRDFGDDDDNDGNDLGDTGPPTDLKSASRAAAAETERRMIRAALELTGGNVTRAAERLGLSRRGLQLKMKELHLR
jgi:DNA-binding NtrC family response regulator